MSDSITKLATALVAVQKEIPTPLKDKVAMAGTFSYAYVGLESVMPEALTILGKYDIALAQTVGTGEDGSTNLTTTLLHVSGEWLTDTQPLLLTKDDSQGQGSAITYARRYGLMSALGIVAEEDDDGNEASKASRRKSAARAAPAKPQRTAPDPRTNGKANANQISIIMRLLEKEHGADEQAQVETIKKINPRAVNDTGTALIFGTLTQDEAGNLIIGLQNKQQEAPAAEPQFTG